MDVAALDNGSARGGDLLYLEGLARLFRHCVGDVIVARTPAGVVVGVGLISCPDRREGLDAAAPGLYRPLPPDACWTEAHYVVPEHRNRRALAAIISEEHAALRQRGVQRAFAMIDSKNVASLRAFARAGYQLSGLIRRDRWRLNRCSSPSQSSMMARELVGEGWPDEPSRADAGPMIGEHRQRCLAVLGLTRLAPCAIPDSARPPPQRRT